MHLDQRLNAVRAEEPLLADDLAKLDQTLRRLTATADAGLQAPVEIPSWVRRDAILDSSTVLESLTRAKLHVQQALALNRTLQDSLAFEAELNRLERRKIEVQREIHIAAKLREASRKIGQLVLEQNIALPARRQAVLADIDENRVKLGTISSLQRLGKTVVSERPVRPRPLRAGLILVLAGGAAGIVLGIVWDYLRANRRVVFRS